MIDPTAIVEGILAGIATRRMQKPVDDTLDGLLEVEPHLTTEQTLYDILHVLLKMYELQAEEHQLRLMTSTGEEDLFYQLPMFTATTGAPFIFRHKGHRQRFVIYATQQVILDINAPGLGTLTKTVPADTWIWLMYPENTQIWLDGSNTFTGINLWIRETNETV
jgi:hypothetical protein